MSTSVFRDSAGLRKKYDESQAAPSEQHQEVLKYLQAIEASVQDLKGMMAIGKRKASMRWGGNLDGSPALPSQLQSVPFSSSRRWELAKASTAKDTGRDPLKIISSSLEKAKLRKRKSQVSFRDDEVRSTSVTHFGESYYGDEESRILVGVTQPSAPVSPHLRLSDSHIERDVVIEEEQDEPKKVHSIHINSFSLAPETAAERATSPPSRSGSDLKPGYKYVTRANSIWRQSENGSRPLTPHEETASLTEQSAHPRSNYTDVFKPFVINGTVQRSAALTVAKGIKQVTKETQTKFDKLSSKLKLLISPPGQDYESGSPLLPDCWLRLFWDFILLIVIFLEVANIMHNLSFKKAASNKFLTSEIFASIVFLVDVWVKMNTAALQGWMIEEDLRTCRRRYLSTWFSYDLILAIPWDLLAWLISPSAHQHVQCLRFGRVVRVPFLFQLSTPVSTVPKAVELVICLFWLFLLIQGTACAWIGITNDYNDDSVDDKTKYNEALYWAVITLTSVGYGDVLPYGNGARAYAGCVAILGALLLVVLGGRVGAYFITTDPYTLMAEERKRRLQAMLARNEIPWDIQKEAFTIYPAILETTTNDYQDTLDELPPFIQDKLTTHIKIRLIQKVPLFKSATQDFIKRLASFLEELIVPPSEYLVRASTTGSEMFFLQYGISEVLDYEEKVVATLKTGSWFGEMSLIRETERVASVRSLTPCVLFRLEKESFENLVQEYPAFLQHIQSLVERRRREERLQWGNPRMTSKNTAAVWTCTSGGYENDIPVSLVGMAYVAVARKKFKALLTRVKRKKTVRERLLKGSSSLGIVPSLVIPKHSPPPVPPATVLPQRSPSNSMSEEERRHKAATQIQRIQRGRMARQRVREHMMWEPNRQAWADTPTKK